MQQSAAGVPRQIFASDIVEFDAQWVRSREIARVPANGAPLATTAPAIEKMGKLIGQVRNANRLLHVNIQLASKSHQILGEISRALDQLGFTMDRLAAGLQVQSQHFDEIRRERMLKEILYKMAKFQGSLASSNDPVAKAHGAKLLLQTIEAHDFGTRDLFDFSDKEFFDRQVEQAQRVLDQLSPDEQRLLEDFERLYAMYLEMDQFDPSALFPKKKPLPLPEMDENADTVGSGIDEMFIDLPTWLRQGYMLLVFATLNLIVLSMVNAMNAPLADHFWMHVSTGVASGLVAIATAGLYFFTRRGDAERNPTLLAERDRQRRERQDRVQRMIEGILAENEEIRRYNEQQEENIRTAAVNHQITKEDVRTVIHGFLDEHPALEPYLPRL